MIDITENIDKLIELLDDSDLVKEYKVLKNELLNDKKLLKKVEKANNLDIYSKEYKELKLELYKNDKYKRLQQIEIEFHLLGLDISNKLNTLTDRKICYDKNN